MLAKHWDTFIIGFIGIVGAFTLGFIWGCNIHSPDYLSIKTTKLADVLPLYGEAVSRGECVQLDKVVQDGQEWAWLHSC